MKSVIADSSIAATNLMNALQSINREVERISENQTAVERFEACKLLRRKVLRYVSIHFNSEKVSELIMYRFIMWRKSSGSEGYFMLMMSLSMLSCLLNSSIVRLTRIVIRMTNLPSKLIFIGVGVDSDSGKNAADFFTVATIKGKEAMAKAASQSPTASQPPDLSELNISTPIHAAPPRPPPMSKPHSNPPPQPPRPVAAPQDEDDEDDPFGDSHALETPMHERDQPKW